MDMKLEVVVLPVSPPSGPVRPMSVTYDAAAGQGASR